MKGVILAGGLGTRLYPLTTVSNKHLLPVYNKPMIYYPIQTLVDAGVKDILIVTGGEHAGEFLRLLGNGHQFGLKHINYTYQRDEGGIAAALKLAKHFADEDKIIVILGDNIIEKDIRKPVSDFKKQPKGAKILIKKVPDPGRFGVVEFSASAKGRCASGAKGAAPAGGQGSASGGDKLGRISRIVEKPKHPKTDYIVTGIYMYDNQVFDIIKTLKPSRRGELEITDVNNAYLKKKELTYNILKGWWTDSGTFDSLLRANELVAGKICRKQAKK